MGYLKEYSMTEPPFKVDSFTQSCIDNMDIIGIIVCLKSSYIQNIYYSAEHIVAYKQIFRQSN